MCIRDRFLDLGYPRLAKSDGGPAFTSQAWTDYCKYRYITNSVSSTANPRSNGTAECGVKRTKGTIKKALAAKEDPYAAVAEYRNLPLARSQYSPHELFYKRQPRGKLPRLQMDYDDKEATNSRRAHRQQNILQRKTARKPAPVLEVGQCVWMYNNVNHLWDLPGKIVERRESDRSYWVRVLTTGGQYLRNRKFLKPRRQQIPQDADESAPTVAQDVPYAPGTRRSARLAGEGHDVTSAPPPANTNRA